MNLQSTGVCNVSEMKAEILSFGSIDEIKRESDEIRSGTMDKISELEREISLIIAEYDDEIVESAHIDRAKFPAYTKQEPETLSDSVRMIKIRNLKS